MLMSSTSTASIPGTTGGGSGSGSANGETEMDFFAYLRSRETLTDLKSIFETVEHVETMRNDRQERRRTLAELTKEFRTLNEQDRLQEIRRLLRSYQEEVDRLTRDCLSVEGTLLRSHGHWQTTLDFVPILQSRFESRSSSSSEVQKLRTEVESLQRQIEKQKIEMQQLLDQVVESEGLREQLQEYKGDAESRIEAAVRLKQESWMKEHHEELTSLREQETALFQEIDSLRNEASMWKTRFSQAQSELVEQIRAFDSSSTAWNVEKDHLNEDIVRLRAEIQTLSGDDESENGRTSKEKRWMEREVELSSSLTELKKERDVLLSRSEDAEAMCARIETELQTHRSLVASLEEDARLRESEHRVFVSSLQSTISNLEKEIASSKKQSPTEKSFVSTQFSDIDKARADRAVELASVLFHPDFAEKILEHLPHLSSVSFPADKMVETSKAVSTKLERNEILDAIVQRVRSMESELVHARNDLDMTRESEAQVLHALEDLQVYCDQLTTEIDKLERENHLLSSTHVATSGSSLPISIVSEPVSRPRGSIGSLESDSALQTPVKEAASGDMAGFNDASSMVSFTSTSVAGSNMHAISQLLTEQRDRYKRRAEELESELFRFDNELRAARVRIQELEEDNIRLVEKSKFMQSYSSSASLNLNSRSSETLEGMVDDRVSLRSLHPSSHSADSAVVGTGNRALASRSSAAAEEAGQRYLVKYEERIDPYSEFRSRERDERLASMNLADRLAFNCARSILGHKYARWFFIAYTILVHIFILLILYRFGRRGTRSNS